MSDASVQPVRLRPTTQNAQVVMASVWAKNHGVDAGDSARDIRAIRAEDNDLVEAKWQRIYANAETRSENDITTKLLAELGLD